MNVGLARALLYGALGSSTPAEKDALIHAALAQMHRKKPDFVVARLPRAPLTLREKRLAHKLRFTDRMPVSRIAVVLNTNQGNITKALEELGSE